MDYRKRRVTERETDRQRDRAKRRMKERWYRDVSERIGVIGRM